VLLMWRWSFPRRLLLLPAVGAQAAALWRTSPVPDGT